MTKNTLEDHAIVAFLQALAVTISNFEELKPAVRNRENFIRGFDGYLGEFVKMAEKEDELDIREKVQFLRDVLQRALDLTSLAKTPIGKPN